MLEYSFAKVRKIADDVEDTRTVEFVISNETKDRHGTVLNINGWKLDNYRANPIVGYQHNVYGDLCSPPNPDDVIGKTNKLWIEDGQLIASVTFEPADLNPQAEKIFRKIQFGTLSMASVGFIPLKGWRQEKDAKGNIIAEHSDEQELLEWSVVNIPSNPSAGKREFSIQADRALRYIHGLIQGRMTIEEMRKMTVNGLIRLASGESLEDDQKEKDAEIRLNEEQEKALKVKKEQEQLSLKLRLMSLKIKEV